MNQQPTYREHVVTSIPLLGGRNQTIVCISLLFMYKKLGSMIFRVIEFYDILFCVPSNTLVCEYACL